MNYFTALLGCCCLLFCSGVAAEVSLRDKIGQMLLVGFEGKTVTVNSPIVKEIEKNNLGGVILFDYNSRTGTYDKNIASPQQVKQLNSDLQSFTKRANSKHHRAQLPLLISVDYEGGKVNRLPEHYGFPATRSAYEVGKGSFEQAEDSARIMADTLKQTGFNLNFAPVLDVNVNPDNPVIGKHGRSFSADANQVDIFASIYARQFLEQNIQCAYKHFPGHGSSSQDSHLGFVDVSDSWKSDELIPYQHFFNSKSTCGMVMTAHIVNRQLDQSGLPATLSHKILTELLRQQLQFEGVIITDDMQMKAISDNYGLEQALVLAINAGADMLIFGNNLYTNPQDSGQLVDIIEAKVLAGEISSNRIDDAYRHIVKLKASLNY